MERLVERDRPSLEFSLDGAPVTAREGDTILTAAGTAWPNASVSLLVSSTVGSGSIIGQRPKGGPNNVIAT